MWTVSSGRSGLTCDAMGGNCRVGSRVAGIIPARQQPRRTTVPGQSAWWLWPLAPTTGDVVGGGVSQTIQCAGVCLYKIVLATSDTLLFPPLPIFFSHHV
jgi:hypothetical protein